MLLVNDKKSDRIKLRYATKDADEIELPFRLLVLGDFTLRETEDLQEADPRPVRIDAENFDEILSAHRLEICLSLDNKLLNSPDTASESSETHVLDIRLPIRSLRDFTPDALLTAIPEMDQLLHLKKRLSECKQKRIASLDVADLPDDFHRVFLHAIGMDAPVIPWDIFDIIIAEIVSRLGRQLDAILHHEDFQGLEAAWRSLHFLVAQLQPGENCYVDVLSISKDDLDNDFEYWKDIFESFLYKTVYVEEFGQFGGHPYGAIIADYEFGPGARDIGLLKNIAGVASLSHAPFIAGAHPAFFGIYDLTEMPGVENLLEMFERDIAYVKWRAFRDAEQARYVGLTLPRFLLRIAYDYKKDDIQSIAYIEKTHTLWGNAAFAFGACLIRSFVRHRWCLNIIGPDAGRVQNLRWVQDNTLGRKQQMIPAEILISEKKEAELSEAGFIPLGIHKGDDYAAFYSANAVKRPKPQGMKLSPEDELNLTLASQLPYLFIICRLAHYIKAIQRDNIGSSKTCGQLEKELNKWIVQYVSDMDNPAPAVRARRPLRKARIRVSETRDEAQKIWYEMELTVIPHLRYRGAVFSLSLEGKLA